jgi:metallo-beta-lactamase family protein
MSYPNISHHGGADGVTGSCHRLQLAADRALLVDCGLFQGQDAEDRNAPASMGAGPARESASETPRTQGAPAARPRAGHAPAAGTADATSAYFEQHRVTFPVDDVLALVVTHVHIDHIGRLPYLLAAGYTGPIICSVPSARLLPLVIEDALKVGFTRDQQLIERFLGDVERRLVPLEYRTWHTLVDDERHHVRIRLQRAGHILGSAYVEVDIEDRSASSTTPSPPNPPPNTASSRNPPPNTASSRNPPQADIRDPLGASAAPMDPGSPLRSGRDDEVGRSGRDDEVGRSGRDDEVGRSGRDDEAAATTRIVFSGDLGAPNSPLLPAPAPPERADILVLESTYGDRVHEDRGTRQARLKATIDHALENGGTVIVPAFSIGRTQELLYELEDLIHHATDPHWQDLEIIVDSPLAARFSAAYRDLKPYWDAEAHERLNAGRHPLAFENLYTVDSHEAHQQTVDYLARTGRPAVVIAASGMAAGGRVVNYLKRMLGDERHDVLFIGYQAAGTPGRAIQRHGPRGGWVELDGERIDIRARIHTIGGYSAHADRDDLLAFIQGIPEPPREIRLIHGEPDARQALKAQIETWARTSGHNVRVTHAM